MIFFAPVQTGPGAHPASYTMGAGSISGVKRPGRGVDHPPPLAPGLKKEYSYTSAPRCVFMGGYTIPGVAVKENNYYCGW